MLDDLRRHTDWLMEQQNRVNEAIEELQNRPPIQFLSLPAMPRRSPYTDTLKNIVDVGELLGTSAKAKWNPSHKRHWRHCTFERPPEPASERAQKCLYLTTHDRVCA
jgi:hypothetical protein